MDIPDALPPNQYVIYALLDPSDEKVYYVGQTRNPQRRLGQHLGARHHKGRKGEWLRRLEQKGQQPRLHILEMVTGERAALEKEQTWIRHFLEQQMPLCNVQAQPVPGPQVFIPLRQETIILWGYPLIVVQLPNGDIAVSLRSLCAMLKVAINRQIKRICNDEVLSKYLLRAILHTARGPQVCAVLTDWAVPLWASGLQIPRLSEEKQVIARLLQQNAGAAIQQAFTQPEGRTSVPEARPAGSASLSLIALLRHPFSVPSEGAAIQATDQHDLKERVTLLEGGAARPVIGVSPQRLAQLYLLANRVRQRYGYSTAKTLEGLVAHVQVEDVYDLPESAWPAILDWFASLLED